MKYRDTAHYTAFHEFQKTIGDDPGELNIELDRQVE